MRIDDAAAPEFPVLSAAQVRAALLARDEIALLDVREEDPFAQSHPLWAANLPLARIELDAWSRIPRRDTLIVLYAADDAHAADGLDDAMRAARRLRALGYTRVHLLSGGLAGWQAAGHELFRDVNVPSKSFGEWVESRRHTPSVPAQALQAMIDRRADVVVLDARRFDEYRTMSIPTAISVPGAELLLRLRDLAPDPATTVIVNCAGRTRSIIGTQSLINVGVPNPVAALRNGTIGWTLAGQALDVGAERRFLPVSDSARRAAQADAADVAARAGVGRIDAEGLVRWLDDPSRTTYLFDVRTHYEYLQSHRRGFRSAPGGQLVQETDVHAPVRGARIVLADHDGLPQGAEDAGVRAEMTASWLAQMGWQVAVLDPRAPAVSIDGGADAPLHPAPPDARRVAPSLLADWLANQGSEVQVIDVAPSASHVARHISGAWFVLRSQLAQARRTVPRTRRCVVTCDTGLLAPYAAFDLQQQLGDDSEVEVFVLDGGTAAWVAAGLPVEHGEARLASPRIDRYRRPYEGTDNAAAAMQAYLDWEFGLVAQLERDGTHFFAPI